MKKKSYRKIFLILVLSSICTYGKGIIKGTVTDSLTSDQLKGAEIILSGTTYRDVSDINGEYVITAIPAGEYILQIFYLGYHGKKYLVNIKSEETFLINIQLQPISTNECETILPDQAKSQTEEINLQLKSNTIKNVIAGNKLKDLPEENLSITLSRLPGVTTLYNPFEPIFPAIPFASRPYDGYPVNFITYGGFLINEDPIDRILIRGLDSKYANTTIDGIRISSTSVKDKSIDLSIFQGKYFKNIEVNKTITSEEDADATAGSINLMTGKAPDKRMINAELMGNYNKLDNSADQYNFSGKYGERFLENLLGVQVNADAEKRIISSEYLKNDFVSSTAFNILHKSYTNAKRERYGANVIFDFNTPDGGFIKFNSIFSKTSAEYLSNQSDTTIWTWSNSDPPNHTFNYTKTEQQVLLSSIGGSNYLFGFTIDWNVAFSEVKSNHPSDFTIHSIGTDSSMIRAGKTEYVFCSIYNPSKGYNKEKIVSVDIYKKYNISNDISGRIKFGGKYRNNSKLYNEHLYEVESLYYNQYRKLADGTLVKRDFSGTRFAGLEEAFVGQIPISYFQDNPVSTHSLFDKYEIPLINKDALQLWSQLNYSPYYVDNGSDINAYNYSGSVFAGYVMHDLDIGQSVKLVTGLRIENERNNYSGYYLKQTTNDLGWSYSGEANQTRMYNCNETNILPNLLVILSPTDFLNLRLAAYKTLIRPDYSARMPKYFSLSYQPPSESSPLHRYLIIGNPDLKNAYVWNYEFQTQFYGNIIGQFSIDAFYKGIKGMQQATNGIQLSNSNQIETLGINLNSLPAKYPFSGNSNFVLYSYYNSPKLTRIWGFEIQHQTNLSYLPGLLRNITLNYNLTFLRSETWAFEPKTVITAQAQNIIAEEKQKLSNMPEFIANVILGYDIEGLSFRISYYYQGEYTIPINYYNCQMTGNKLSRLDIAARQKILSNIYIILNLNNITNTKEEFTFHRIPDIPSQPYQAYRRGFNLELGFGVDL